MRALRRQGRAPCGQDIACSLQHPVSRGLRSGKGRPSSRKESSHSQQPKLVTCSAAQAVQASPTKNVAADIKPPGQGATKVVFWSEQGKRVVAAVEKSKDGFRVHVAVEGGGVADLQICWGLYRTSAAKWQVPKDLSPANSTADPATGGMCSPLTAAKGQAGVNALTWSTSIPGRLAPVFLAFKLKHGRSWEGSRHGQHFAVPVGMGVGDPRTLGPTLSAVEGATCSVNFALRSRHASAMSLCLARRVEAPTSNGSSGTAGAAQPGKGYLELALDPEINRTGDVWHVCLQGLRDVGTLCYGWRAESTLGSDFVPGQVMLDPQAPLATHVQLPRGAHMSARTGRSAARPSHDLPALMGSLAFLLDDFAFGRDHQRPSLPLQNTVVMEVDIPSFSTGPASRQGVPSEHQGKILGVLDRLGDIRAVGANVVMLSSPCLAGEGDGPFNRAPFSFFAPEAAWATGKDALAPMRELKQVVHGLHEKGLEVWLQVQFCFTAEGNEDEGCTVCLRGLDAPIYYRQRGVLNCGHAVVRQLVLDALVHWRREYRVDGFVFVNAETLVLDRNGNVLDNPPLAETIAAEPLLADVRLVAWPGDLGLLPRGGQRGFPHWGRWMERNLRAGSDLLRFLGPVNGSEGEAEGQSRASALATRLTGSADMFAAQFDEGLPGSLSVSRLPGCGLNGVSILSKSSLRDTVAELLPGHDGMQGGPHAMRATLTKTLLMATVLMLGSPLLTQEVMDDPALSRFAGVLVRTRRRLGDLISPRDFDSPRTIAWHGASAGSQPDWDGSALAAHVPGAAFMGLSASLPGARGDSRGFYMGLNGHEHAVEAYLPPAPTGCEWRRVIDSAREAPDDAVLDRAGAKLESQDSYWVNGKAGALLVAAPLPQVSAPASAASREFQRRAPPSTTPS